MVRDDSLSAVLSEFARTLITDLPFQGILDHLVERIVEVLPVTAAAVTMISPGKAPRYLAASDKSAVRFEQLQTTIHDAPCRTAYKSGKAVAVPDLRTDQRFDRFAPAAIAAGLAAVFSFPLQHGDGRLGALDLYRDTPGGLDADDMHAAQTLADVAAAYVLNAQALQEARDASERFHYSALHDPLTGLPNRLLLQERLEHAAQRAKRSRTYAAILFADLDHFKEINDSYGHQVGDELLLAVARRLSCLVRSSDTLARFSGDEFVFLCEDLHSPEDVEVLAKRIDEAFASPFALSGTNLTVTASVGMAFAGPGEDISNHLVVKADMAMYQVKRKGGAGHQIIDLRDAIQANDERSLEDDLRVAVEQHSLDVAYQPIVRSADGLVTGVEALLRWTHPDRGPISPMAAIAAAEQSGLIGDIGSQLLERGCRDRSRWLKEHAGVPLDLAVNISAQQLIAPDFCATVADVLARMRTDPTVLIFEMTENIFSADRERAIAVMSDLRAQGIRLALDDFGAGYSSLSDLRRLPIHIVKLDRSFIADIDQTPTGTETVAAVTNLAHVLGLTVTAEGVETQSQQDAVLAVGCESAQGYFFARPMPASAMAAQLGVVTAGGV
jgi:diguanylate cyclase (GGDEF)-like protein